MGDHPTTAPFAEPPPARSGGLWRAGWILLILLFLAAIVLDAFFSETGILQVWTLEEQYKLLAAEVSRLEGENAELEAEIVELRARPEAIERVAREQLGFVRPGEDTFLFPAPPEEDSRADAPPQPPQPR